MTHQASPASSLLLSVLFLVTLFCEHGQLLAWQPLCSGSSVASSEQLVQYLTAARCRAKTKTHQASLASSRL